jgi:hypothetical protein
MQDDTDDLHLDPHAGIITPLSRVITVKMSNLVSFAGLMSVTFDLKSSNSASHDPY